MFPFRNSVLLGLILLVFRPQCHGQDSLRYEDYFQNDTLRFELFLVGNKNELTVVPGRVVQ
ncbi:MAG: hypothetical protein ACK480_12305, partial [Planctomycetota bacterium]